MILALGYVLLNAANSIIDLLAGGSWRRSGLNWWLRQRQLDRRQKLKERTRTDTRLALKWELVTHFPSVNIERTIQATRLGNALVANQQTIWRRYGLDIAAFWSPMEASVEVKEAPALISAKDEKATLDLLANLVFVLSLFGIEALVFFAARREWVAVLLSLLAVVGAYGAYRVAVDSARSWGDAMQVVFDLHRGELRKGLGLREPTDLADERALWQGARHFYLPGDDKAPPKDLFKAEDPPPALRVAASSSLTVEEVAVVVVDAVVEDGDDYAPDNGDREQANEPESEQRDAPAAIDDADPPRERAVEVAIDEQQLYPVLLRYLDYLLIASRESKSCRDGGVDLVIDDRRVRRVRLPEPIKAGNVCATPAVMRAGEAEQLHWRLDNLPRGASMALDFRLPLWRLTFQGDAPRPRIINHSGGFELTFAGGEDKVVVIVLESLAPLKGQPRLIVNGKEEVMDLSDRDRGLFRSSNHQLLGGDSLWVLLPAVSS
ncbi:MAG: hypothetical protein WKF41_13170 [Gaiellaceae bacterium]